MSTHKHIDRICVAAVVLSLVLTILFMNGSALGILAAASGMGYEDRLFDAARVHTIDIVINDWDAFLETAQSEEYSVCNVVIDGEAYHNVGIRGKGNTSLSMVRSMDSSRYSFKLEFDQYDSTKSYYGLDKLSLNNLIQDTTYMKDFLTYQMMSSFGGNAPLCSFVYITVNGEDWGLYLAVEGVEDAFLQRNYGTDYGELYKPDTGEIGGGRGNGQNFDPEEFFGNQAGGTTGEGQTQFPNFGNMGGGTESSTDSTAPSNPFGGGMPQGGFGGVGSGGGADVSPDSTDPSNPFGGMPQGRPNGAGSGGGADVSPDSTDPTGPADSGFTFPGGFDPSQMFGGELPEDFDPSQFFGEDFDPSQFFGEDFDPLEIFGGNGGGFGMMGMGSSDVMLQYVDDEVDSYSNIFDNAKTDITTADKTRLVASLKSLSDGEDLEKVLDIDQVLRYFVVHNFVVNSDSYTGQMIHNYYLYEEDGKLSMIPWDYNLAFGTFQNFQESAAVNDPIDSPISVTGDCTRPMVDWIFQSAEYTELYHQYFEEFLADTDIMSMIADTAALIAPYVETDPTAFYGYEAFETGVAALTEFCELRIQSVRGQLSGTIPFTAEGQAADSSALIDATTLELSDMGTMSVSDVMAGMMGGSQDEQNGGFAGFPGGQGGMQWPGQTGGTATEPAGEGSENADTQNGGMSQFPGSMQRPGQMGTTPSDTSNETTDAQNQGMTRFPGGTQMSIDDMGNISASDSGENTTLLLIGVSVLVLAVGIIILLLYKRIL